MRMVHEVQYGLRKRMSFSRIEEVLEMPDLIEVQKNSYERFLKHDLADMLKDIGPIVDTNDRLCLELTGFEIDYNSSKYTMEQCKENDATYAAPLWLQVRLINRSVGGEIKPERVFMGDFPLMTPQGTFIINGAERVIVSQLVRSPGVYYAVTHETNSGTALYSTQIIPDHGAWIEYETEKAGVLTAKLNRQTGKLTVTALARALGELNELARKHAKEAAKERSDDDDTVVLPVRPLNVSSDADLREMFGEDTRLNITLAKDESSGIFDSASALSEIYKRLKPGERYTEEEAEKLLRALFFNEGGYNLARVGRHKLNKKLSLAARIEGLALAAPVSIIDFSTGEVTAELEEGRKLSHADATAIEESGIEFADVIAPDGETVRVRGNCFADPSHRLGFSVTLLGLDEGDKVHFPTLNALLDMQSADATQEQTIAFLKDNMAVLSPRGILFDDLFASISYLIGLIHQVGSIDNIDHLGNRRIRSVGELLQNEMRKGFIKLKRNIQQQMNGHDLENAMPSSIINTRPVMAIVREFFGSSQLSQFMDQTNPLAELTSKRRLSALGPGGMSRDRAGFEARDVHFSHYGRMCPIETPEGPNIGLINSLSTYARINKYGLIETPYRIVDSDKKTISREIVYLTADEEEGCIIAQANEPLTQDKHGNEWFKNPRIIARQRDQIIETDVSAIEYMDVSPKQLVSVATAMIPFLENDDANRALMGSNMQRQSVPLLIPEAPIVGTGMEFKAAHDSGVVILARRSGTVTYVCADCIRVSPDEDPSDEDEYRLIKFKHSNQGTCINQRPLVIPGQHVEAGECIGDGASTDKGEIALGRNILIGFMTWEGYNYEDAVLISEELVRDDVYTSIHIEKHEVSARETKLGPEEITADIQGLQKDALRNLDARGIVCVGAEVRDQDVLVGKVTPKAEAELTPDETLLRAIFGEKARDVRDTSLRVPHGEAGIVVDVKIFKRDNKDDLPPGVRELVRVYIAQKRKISVGDKMAGRHGNKGVISRILPVEDMPFLPDGTPLQIVLNPLGVPSRMNIGQILELHLGWAAKALGWHIATPVFDGATEKDIQNLLEQAGYNGDGKTVLRDGRSGEEFENRITVGYMYYLKLAHLVDDKIHARAIGPYSLITQQPLGGKAQFGGQRFGEMEVWALEAYGAANTLQELLTIKSDDISGRADTFKNIVQGHGVPAPGVPESFKVLIKELQALALDVRIIGDDDNEISLDEMSTASRDDIFASDRNTVPSPHARMGVNTVAAILNTDNGMGNNGGNNN